MKLQYIDHGFYKVTRKFALEICGKLPKLGYEKLAKTDVIETTSGYVWVAQTVVNGKRVWSIRNAGTARE